MENLKVPEGHPLPSKDNIRHLVLPPEPKNCQVCYALKADWVGGWFGGYANVLRTAEHPCLPHFLGKTTSFQDYYRHSHWCLDHHNQCDIKPYAIVDSGLYSLLAGTLYKQGYGTAENMWKWLKVYEEFIDHAYEPGVKIYSDNEPYFVDVDAQRYIGVDATRQLRKELRERHPRAKFIHVWHPEDGEVGIYEFAENYDYVAIGGAVKGAYRFDRVDVATKMKMINPSIKIHLLGCQSPEELRRVADIVTTTDASSYFNCVRYGKGCTLHFSNFKSDKAREEYIRWVVHDSGLTDILREVMPKIRPLLTKNYFDSQDLPVKPFDMRKCGTGIKGGTCGWTDEKLEMTCWLVLDAADYFYMFEREAGHQARFVRPDGTVDGAMSKVIEKLFHHEKVTMDDYLPGPYELVPHDDVYKRHCDKEPRHFTMYGPYEYQHINTDGNRKL